MDLGTIFDSHRNSLNALRLAFATMVIVAHSWPLTGRSEAQGVGPYNEAGAWAVSGFFVISGFLITMSRDRTMLGPFLWRRLLRIYPAYLVVLLVTAFAFAPLSTVVMGEYSVHAAATYVVKNLALYNFTFDISGTLQDAPFPGTWNGSLWTLFFEALCYLATGIAMSLVPRYRLGVAFWVVVGVGTAATAAHVYLDVLHINVILHALRLGTFFAAGAIVYVYRGHITIRWWWAAVAAVVTVATVATGTFSFLGPLPLAYLCLWGGVVLPLHRIGASNDVSYGMYIYAFPVQQLLAITIGPRLSVWVFALIAITCTIPFAWASWLLIERPAMTLKRLTTGRRASRVAQDTRIQP